MKLTPEPGGISQARFVACLFLGFVLAAVAQSSEAQRLIFRDSKATAPKSDGDSTAPSLDRSGRWVVFTSAASNLVTNDTNGSTLDVFVHDRLGVSTRLVSLASDGLGSGDGDSLGGVVSPDGRWAVFESQARNLVTNTVGGVGDVFLRDLVQGSTRLLSRTQAGKGGNGASTAPRFSGDGLRVVFESAATDLWEGDINGVTDLFLADLSEGSLRVLTPDKNGAATPALGLPDAWGGSTDAVMSYDGRFTAFQSSATNLVAGDSNGMPDVFVRDVVSGTTWMVSSGLYGNPATGVSSAPSISADGRFVAFQSTASNLVSGMPDNPYARTYVYRRDMQEGVTRQLAMNPASGPVISPDGRLVAFLGETNQLMLWDQGLGYAVIISTNAAGAKGAGMSDSPAFSPDGTKLVFLTAAPDVAPPSSDGAEVWRIMVRDLIFGETRQVFPGPGITGQRGSDVSSLSLSEDASWVAMSMGDVTGWSEDANGCADVFLLDAQASRLEPVTRGAPMAGTVVPAGYVTLGTNAVSADGRWIAFVSSAPNLVAADSNGELDVFVLDRASGEVRLVSVRHDGLESANGVSTAPMISADGSRVAFVSMATDLVNPTSLADTNASFDVFVRDIPSGVTRLASVNRTRTGAGSAASLLPFLSADGRRVVYQSASTNMMTGDHAGDDVYLFDWEAGTNRLVNITASGWPDYEASVNPALSADGRWVYFWSRSTQLITNYVQSRANLFARDLQVGRTYLITSNIPTSGPTSSEPGPPAVLTPDGSAVLFRWSSTPPSLYHHAFAQATNTLVRTNCTEGALSDDGRHLVFEAFSPYAYASAQPAQIYVRDIGRTNELVSHNHSSTNWANGASSRPALSPDGRFVVFRSRANNLIAGQVARTNSLFLYDRYARRLTDLGDAFLPAGSLAFISRPILVWGGRAVLFTSDWNGDGMGDYNRLPDLFEMHLPDAESSPALRVTRVPGQGTEISWPAIGTARYRVEFARDPARGPWAELSATIRIQDQRATVTDVASLTNAWRFYRVALW